MAFELSAGCGFFVPSGPKGDHLFFCVLGPIVIDGVECILSVPICTAEGRYDASCVLEEGEHSFIKHKSYVSYAQARVDRVSVVKDHLDSEYFRVAEPASVELSGKILAGLRACRRVPRYIKDDWLQ